MKKIINDVLARAGYELRPIGEPAVKLHTYRRADGAFDGEAYKRIQTEGNKAKLDRVWAVEDNIAFLSAYLLRTIGNPSFGICHGTRRGLEQQWFRAHLSCNVIGTEISNTATQFPHTIQWDFHDVKPEWIDAVDFIYSNSFDHSHSPELCLQAWMRCVRPGGLCILEHSDMHEPAGVTELDPFGASLVMMPYLVTRWAEGRFGVREILEAPTLNDMARFISFIVVQRFA